MRHRDQAERRARGAAAERRELSRNFRFGRARNAAGRMVNCAGQTGLLA